MLRNWYQLVIPFKISDIDDISINKDHPGYYLKKLRIINNIEMSTIAKDINVSVSNLRVSEAGLQYFGEEISMKLAQYFNLDTKYFYDQYLEETDDINIKLKSYINKNNISLKQLSDKINMDIRALKTWLNRERKPSRETYKKLKKLHII